MTCRRSRMSPRPPSPCRTGRHIVVTSELRTPAGSGRDGEAFRALDGWTAIVLRGDDIATPMLDY